LGVAATAYHFEAAVIVRELKGHKHGERHRNDDQPRNHAVRHFAGLIRLSLDRYRRALLGRNDLAEVKARHQARHNSAIRRIRRPIVMKASIGDGMILRGRFAVSARRLEIWFQSALNFSVAVLVSSTMDQLGSVI
jgi:hypothetical protein